MRKTFIAIIAAALPLMLSAQDWKPAGDRIRTRWAEDVSPEKVHGEYPRPQMKRAGWQSLNGLWDYSVTNIAATSKGEAAGRILVPFALESSLSGVGRTISKDDALWYSRDFSIPAEWKKNRVILNFGAVDWGCEVYVNGEFIGKHTGGYTAFSFDITSALRSRGAQNLTVKVTDATENNYQPRGKQVLDPKGIWYTPVSGIWQSVWMESVSRTAYLEDYRISTEIADGQATIRIKPVVKGDYDLAMLEVEDNGVFACTEGKGELSMTIENPKLWTPDTPYLYDFVIKLKKGNKIVDRIEGYTALRSISTVKDADGHLRMALNGKPLFQFGPLDQGWWPDGLYTAPTDEALRYDIEMTKALGFNMIRKHIKVEPARWYYWCDKLGMLVWQDMPSICDSRTGLWSQGIKNEKGEEGYDLGKDCVLSDAAKDNFRKEWKEIMTMLDKFNCIVVWVPFNEGWGQFDTKQIAEFTRLVDPTRLINAASGGNWVSGHIGDILDSHHYPSPKLRIRDEQMINVLGEYGGIGLPLDGHLWKKDNGWGYVKYKNGNEVTDAYVEYTRQLIPLVKNGCAAAVYTQTTDVETEVNGFMTYDRAITKPDVKRVSEANRAVIESMGL